MNPQEEGTQELPATIDDAVHALLAILSDEVKAEVAAKSRAQLVELHFGLGAWIRDNFGLWQGNAALAQDAGTEHPDDIAGVIIEALWNYLRSAETKADSPIASTAGSSAPSWRDPKMAALRKRLLDGMVQTLNHPQNPNLPPPKK